MIMSGALVGVGFLNEIETMGAIKGKVSGIYEEMGDFIVKTTEHMNSFRKMMTPYVNYFYSMEAASGESFISDVVAPSRRELDEAIDRSVSIMAGDEGMNDNVSGAIGEVLRLEESIDMILRLIDEIDIYSENMLIISTKYGAEGLSLARISNEMVSMARLVNGIGAKFREYLNEMDTARVDFNDIRKKIEAIGENHLTRLKLDLSHEFPQMTRELDDVSAVVNNMLSSSDEVEGSMRNFISNIQMEDVIRQKIERILYYLEELKKRKDADEGTPFEELDAIVLHVVSDQLLRLDKDVSWQYDEIRGFCDRISLLLDDILSRFYGSGKDHVEEEQNRMDGIYARIEGFKDDYVRYMEEIIADKKRLLKLCTSIRDILELFEGLFGGIMDTVKKFEALNMITRIELARHAKLSRTLGGTLASVKTLPAQMKQIVSQSVVLYHGVYKNITDAVARYEESFSGQEAVLADCIESIKRVSVKLYESQKYYGDISREVGRYSWKVLDFIAGNGRMSGLFEIKESIRDIMAGINAYREAEFGGRGYDVENIRQWIQDTAMRMPAVPVVAALHSDFGSEKSKEQVIIF
jgi:hypothetical protein